MASRSAFRPAWPWAACVAVCLLWPASHRWSGWAAIGGANHRLVIEVGPGWLGLTAGPIRRPPGTVVGPRTGVPPAVHVHRVTALDRQRSAFPQVYPAPGEYRLYTPLWMATISATLFAAGLFASRWLQGRRPPSGRCGHCGYDLRASPDRCPECGSAVGRTAETKKPSGR